ncbi:MAG: dihydrolipoamide acetyltransferase family protein [Paracoccaceae bacterium]|nr:dihydrolipoamide acetyltransferase family protein [Paracoccaceae bacterium]
MGLFVMPSLGADMEAGKLIEWLVKPGDTVARGDVVAVVETQKGAIEIEIFEAGKVASLQADVGQTLPVGAPLAQILAAGAAEMSQPFPLPEQPPAAPPELPSAPPEPAPEPPGPEMPAPQPIELPDLPPSEIPLEVPPEATGVAASPAARARAAAAGLALASLCGSGPGGAILLADVERHLTAAPEQSAKPGPAKPGLDMVEMRRAIAAAMVRSKREIPHYYLSQSVDLQPATDWLTAINSTCAPEDRLLMGALFVKATVRALAKAPELNGVFTNGGFIRSDAVHAGLVVALRGGGLIAPAIRDADSLTLTALMAAMRDIVDRARNGRLRNSELTTGTITASIMGEGGAEVLYGVIYPPQVALVGFGTPARRPWVVGDAVLPRHCVTVTLAADHRVSDGRRGARLLTEIAHLLTEPETL